MNPTQLTAFAANHTMLVGIFFALFVALVANEVTMLMRRFKALGPAELTNLINRENALLIDVGSIADYESGHIAGARHVAMSQFDPDNKELSKVRDLPVAIYCKSGQTSADACARLGKAGFSKVYWLDGGLNAWLAADLPVVKGKA